MRASAQQSVSEATQFAARLSDEALLEVLDKHVITVLERFALERELDRRTR